MNFGGTMNTRINKIYLDTAERDVQRNEVIRSAIISLFSLIIGVILGVIAIFMISSGAADSDSAKILLAILLISAIVVIAGSILATVLTVWSGLGYQYVQLIRARNAIHDAEEELFGIAGLVLEMTQRLPGRIAHTSFELSRDTENPEESVILIKQAVTSIMHEEIESIEKFSPAISEEIKTRIPAMAGD